MFKLHNTLVPVIQLNIGLQNYVPKGTKLPGSIVNNDKIKFQIQQISLLEANFIDIVSIASLLSPP